MLIRDSMDIRFDAGLSNANWHDPLTDELTLVCQIGLDNVFAMNAVRIAESAWYEKFGKLGVLSSLLANSSNCGEMPPRDMSRGAQRAFG